MKIRKRIDLKGNPFYLNDQDSRWVENTLNNMNITEKVGQLFCPVFKAEDEDTIKDFIKSFKPGGIIYNPDKTEKIKDIDEFILNNSKIPLLISLSLEAKGIEIGTNENCFNAMLMAAASEDKMCFNGLVVTDATLMLGDTVPKAIASGCDMLLSSENIAEDFSYMIQGMIDGILSKERLDEAVKRILAFKAALGLHKRKKAGTMIPNLLPVTLEKHKKIIPYVLGDKEGGTRKCVCL